MSVDDFMTVREAALFLGYSPQHVRLLIRHAMIQGVKRGRDWMVSRESAAAYRIRQQTPSLFSEKQEFA